MPHVCERCGGACATCVGDTGVHVVCVWVQQYMSRVWGVQGCISHFCGEQGCMLHMWEVQGCMPHVCGRYKSTFHMWLRVVGCMPHVCECGDTCHMYVGVQGCMPPVCRGTGVQAT